MSSIAIDVGIESYATVSALVLDAGSMAAFSTNLSSQQSVQRQHNCEWPCRLAGVQQ